MSISLERDSLHPEIYYVMRGRKELGWVNKVREGKWGASCSWRHFCTRKDAVAAVIRSANRVTA